MAGPVAGIIDRLLPTDAAELSQQTHMSAKLPEVGALLNVDEAGDFFGLG